MEKNGVTQRYLENRVITDDVGGSSVMVYIEKFYLDEVVDGAPHVPHPAFLVDGEELDGLYISKYQNVIENGRAYSRAGEDPATHIDFDGAVRACDAKGCGFHLLTAMEWGAIALWCRKNGWLPYGNNDMGRDIRESQTVARVTYRDEEKAVCRVATGTGPIAWSHNRRADGIYDLNGNVWEWVGGLRLVYGELQVLPNNNAASGRYSQEADSADWRAIDGTSGAWLIPDGRGTTQNSIKLDMVDGRWTYVTADIADRVAHYRFCPFSEVAVHPSVCEAARWQLIALGCLLCGPAEDVREVELYANNGAAERMLFRGGRWGQGRNAGVFKSCLDDPRTFSGAAVGFRSAYAPRGNRSGVLHPDGTPYCAEELERMHEQIETYEKKDVPEWVPPSD